MSRQTTGPLLKLCNAKAKQTGETMNFADRLAIILECLIVSFDYIRSIPCKILI